MRLALLVIAATLVASTARAEDDEALARYRKSCVFRWWVSDELFDDHVDERIQERFEHGREAVVALVRRDGRRARRDASAFGFP